MARYKYDKHLSKSDDTAFDKLYKPGEHILNPGIYRCEGCGKEIAHNVGEPLPPQNHHQHDPAQGGIRWRLVVWG
jgi:hypothetical protein